MQFSKVTTSQTGQMSEETTDSSFPVPLHMGSTWPFRFYIPEVLVSQKACNSNCSLLVTASISVAFLMPSAIDFLKAMNASVNKSSNPFIQFPALFRKANTAFFLLSSRSKLMWKMQLESTTSHLAKHMRDSNNEV